MSTTEDISSRLTSAIADYDPDVSSTDDLITLLQDARREIERLRGHSVILNRVAWAIHDALGVIEPGAESHWGDIEADLPRVCELIRAALATEVPS